MDGQMEGDMHNAEIESALEGCEFFKGLAVEDIQQIAGLCRQEKFEVGEYLFRQGDFGDHIYIIAEGQVFLERDTSLGPRKGTVIIGALGKGRICGCWSTILGAPHNLMSSAVCQKPTQVVVVKGSDLRQRMRESTEFGFNVLERLCFLLRDRIEAAYGAMENI